jgi:DNA processing protein
VRREEGRGSGSPGGDDLPPRGWPDDFVSGTSDRDALLVLSHLDGLTPRRLHALAWEEGSARRCLAAVLRGRAGSSGDRDRVAGISPEAVRAILTRLGARQVCPDEEAYPLPLLDLPDPPASLFVLGRMPSPAPPAVAVVGARRCSAYGREIARGLGGGLATAGLTVVSGAALGIDAAAHRGALSSDDFDRVDRAPGEQPNEGRYSTIAVLGSGIDVFHPPSNRGLIEQITAAGAVVSEYPPGTPALPWRFPARNRLVAGLSRAVVVVEGAPGSGSMITAEFALDLGRDVFGVPGPVTSPLSAVPHLLIRDGAWLARGPEDVLEVLGFEAPGLQVAGPEAAGGRRNAVAGEVPGALGLLPPMERRALEAVAGDPVTVDAVAQDTGLPIGQALSVLVALELRGLVREVAGRYERTASSARLSD